MNIVYSIFPYLDFEKIATDKNYILTCIWVLCTQISFIIFWMILHQKIKKINISIEKEIDDDIEKIDENPYLRKNWALYNHHLFKFKDNVYKTEDFAEDFFNNSLIQKILNLRFWWSIPGSFVGFGILGTFVGLTLGISGFSLESSTEIQESIKNLLGGIGTAFLTSLHGIALSILFGFIEKHQFHKFNFSIQKLCDFLNQKFKLTKKDKLYIDDMKQKDFKDYIDVKLKDLFISTDSEGKELTPANLLRDMLIESEKQSISLESFSTDLAEVIIDKFEESTEKTLLPKFTEILHSLKDLDTGIKAFSSSTGKDIGKGVNQAIESLQEELKTVVADFREAFSSGAMQQLNKVVESLDESAIVMENMPELLKTMLNEIRQTSQNEIESRQQQMSLEFDNTISKFKESMETMIDNISSAERQQKTRAEELLESSSKEATKRQNQISSELEDLISVFKESTSSIISNLTTVEDKQIQREQTLINTMNDSLSQTIEKVKDMMVIQEQSKDTIQGLLNESTNSIKEGISLSEKFKSNVLLMMQTTDNFEKISKDLNLGFKQLDQVSSRLNETSILFSKDYEKLSDLNTETFTNIENALDLSKDTLSEFSNKFEIMHDGMKDIFSEIEKGLKSYSQTTREGINNALASFTSNLSEAAKSLSGSIEILNELFEEIDEKLER